MFRIDNQMDLIGNHNYRKLNAAKLLDLYSKDCGFVTPICLMRLPDQSGEFIVTENLVYLSKEMNIGIIVKPGYVTNGASTPRIIWSFVDPFSGLYLAPAILHDSLYDAKTLKRSDCDRLFREAMLSCGVNKIQTEIMFRAVRTFGKIFWETKHALSSEHVVVSSYKDIYDDYAYSHYTEDVRTNLLKHS